ncbi:hypothetical protein LXA47_08300 [Massilia sp. P8910]|uniref:hypothetical protein n=1 Tax=Massilia antarctica TaxID=2765360 RepID=UPI001E3492A6|nr:hypothetical protein [Massilia antarctica]MCE3603606.1 hypothetical protein [Massilia antarctica]
MKKMWIFAVGIGFTLPALAQDVKIASFDPTHLHLSGSYCSFERKPREIVLASDWAGKFWMKVDGKMLELVSHQSDDLVGRQLAGKRWDVVLSSPGLTIELRLLELGRGEDSAAYKGYIELKQHGSRTRISITGGCGT